jgi:hypothetical protein
MERSTLACTNCGRYPQDLAVECKPVCPRKEKKQGERDSADRATTKRLLRHVCAKTAQRLDLTVRVREGLHLTVQPAAVLFLLTSALLPREAQLTGFILDASENFTKRW